MKTLIKRILGDNLVFAIIEFKNRWLPSEEQRREAMIELEFGRRRAEFYSSFINPDDLVFDVGANVGNRIGPLLTAGARVIAVEPQENCYKLLRYKYGGKIEIVTKGLDETECVRDFHISNISPISSFSDEWINSVKDGRFKQYRWDKTIQVEMTTLDKLIDTYGTPKFIKIDVEGYELNVLRGLSKSIAMVSFEYTVPEQTDKVLECIECIKKNDPEIECNYSVGETMVLELQDWQSPEDMKRYVQQNQFAETRFGDVYIRRKTPDRVHLN